jgi:SAM-dependent methyltransferase
MASDHAVASSEEASDERYGATARPAACRICASRSLSLTHDQIVIADPLPAVPRFRSLWACEDCDACWSNLPPSIAAGSYYRAKPEADHALLESDSGRRFKRVRHAVEHAIHASSYRLLDVGCATGAHFDAYGNEVDKFGIEPAASAAESVRMRGATYLGGSLDDAPESAFDVVAALDVIEHIEHPRPFLDGLACSTAPGGVVVIVTGNIKSFSARWGGARWLYYALPEHCSFYSPQALDRYWVGERGYVPVTKTWIANKDVSLGYLATFLRGVAVESLLKILPQSQVRGLELEGRARFPFFCDNMLLTYRKPN